MIVNSFFFQAELAIIGLDDPGVPPPQPPRAYFGRDELIESVVGLAENMDPVALIGTGGIGKTSVALMVLHDGRVKERFGDKRRFIRCDQFPASRVNFLHRLSEAIGAGVENPEDLTALRPSLSSKKMLVVLDNAESILDQQGIDGQGIYRVVEELSQFSNIWLIITSRITTIPPNCQTLEVPTLPIDAARSAFHHIYNNNEQPDLIDKILEQLEFHPLSVTLLATAAHQNGWDNSRLTREWEQQRTGVLQTKHNESLAATIELSLASPTFQKLGPNSRELLAIIAFFPQGVDEKNLDWLFPTISDRSTIFDEFCSLSLTYRSNGFITMLVPLRDYLCPEDPLSSPLLCSTKEQYFTRLSAKFDPEAPGFKETRWITSEVANVEHLLNVLLSIDMNSDGVWRACKGFLRLLYQYKPRRIVLVPKIEGLPDDHPSKLKWLLKIARLSESIGNYREEKRLLEHALRLERERGDGDKVSSVLGDLSIVNERMGLLKEAIGQAREVVEICGRSGDAETQGNCLVWLAVLLHKDKQLDAAEEAASRAIKILPEKDKGHFGSHRVLGDIYESKGKKKKAIQHYEIALTISPSGQDDVLVSIHRDLAALFYIEEDFDKAQAHIEQARRYQDAVDDPFQLGQTMFLRASIYYHQGRVKDSWYETMRALNVFEEHGYREGVEACRSLLQDIGPPPLIRKLLRR